MQISPNSNLTQGLLGGLLIGSSASILMMREHKIMGSSGIISTALEPFYKTNSGIDASSLWTWSFIAGLLSSGTVLLYIQPEVFGGNETTGALLSPLGAALAGTLTGFGTKTGGGCTSGHGICGLPRRSTRSLTAVCSFMLTGGITVYAMKTYGSTTFASLFSKDGCSSITNGIFNSANTFDSMRPLILVLGGAFISHRLMSIKTNRNDSTNPELIKSPKTIVREPSIFTHLSTFSCGAIFGLGLGIGGMLNPDKVSGFLDITGLWDYTLAGVMGGGVMVTSIVFEWMRRTGRWPEYGLKFHPHTSTFHIDYKLISGAAMFGVGWGLGGVCPGPATASLPGAILQGSGNSVMTIFMPFMFLGMAVQKYFA